MVAAAVADTGAASLAGRGPGWINCRALGPLSLSRIRGYSTLCQDCRAASFSNCSSTS